MAHENIPDYEPTELAAGETLAWTKYLPDYPASEWALTYYVRGAGAGFNILATADGDVHSITVPAATTASLAEGLYYWQGWAAKDSEKHLIGSGQVQVRKDFTTVPTGTVVDSRSLAKQTLDAIDAMVLGKATRDQQEYMIGNRSLKRIPIPDLINLRKEYAKLYAQERRTARTKRGGTYLQNINTRFDTPR